MSFTRPGSHLVTLAAALIGAVMISFSAIFYGLARVSPMTGAFYRVAYALPLLFLIWFIRRGQDQLLVSVGQRSRAGDARPDRQDDPVVSVEQIGAKLALIDEVLTPDSSRFWDVEQYVPGSSPQSFDKQFVRDFVAASGWNKEPPAPALPAEVISGTRDRYVAAYERLTGRTW